MTNGSTDIPEWIESRIEDIDSSKDLQQRHVAEVFVDGDRPYYNKKKVSAAIGKNVSNDTVENRLNELVNLDVLREEEINNGYIYWLNRDESHWPIPPDVNPAPSNQLTVKEWRKKPHVQFIAASIFLLFIGTALIVIGSFEISGLFQTPVNVSVLLASGFTLGVTSYTLLLLAGLIWIFSDEIEKIATEIKSVSDKIRGFLKISTE